MRRAKQAQNTLRKPFKSPARVATKTDTPDVNSTPTQPSRKRPVPRSAPPLSTLLKPSPTHKRDSNNSQTSTLDSEHPPTITPARKRARKTPNTLSARRLSSYHTPHDPEINALVQEKHVVQRQLAEVREETALLERALTLREKDDANVVDALIAKWQIACSAACDDLFALLKPAMEAQRDSAALGLALGFGDDKDGTRGGTLNGRNRQQTTDDDDSEDSGDSGSSDSEQIHEDIDIPYMLKQFNIDPELF
ncbi:hypothetical protein IWW50_003187 [Coemansia erecta]|nr:hypothetical protein IWW50_003187 [Coemansia erecta]